jgi:hypothetical protein
VREACGARKEAPTRGAPRVSMPGMSRVLRINPPAVESATRLVLGLGLSVILVIEHPRG